MNNTVSCYKRATKLPLLSIACTPLSAMGISYSGTYSIYKSVPANYNQPITNRSIKKQTRVVVHDC